MTSNIQQSLFFPCEILHSKDLSSACNNKSLLSSSPTADDAVDQAGQRATIIIICHKTKKSFYNSTRKTRRTADRIWSAAFPNNDSCCSARAGDGYFIGKEQPSLSSPSSKDKGAISRDDADAAICKRLSSEFGTCIEMISLGVPNASVIKYCAKENDGQGATTNQEDQMNVIFFDLDKLIVQDSAQKMQYESMQQVLASLMQNEACTGTNFIVHLKSEAVYKIVASSSSSSSAVSMSGAELESALLSNNDPAEEMQKVRNDNRTALPTSTKVIRRLQSKKGAANCPLTIYPPRFIELPPLVVTSCSSSSDGSAGGAGSSSSSSDKEVRTVEICRFHSYDAERGCLRSKKAKLNSQVKGCDMDHDHCHRCGGSHRAFECPRGADGARDDDDKPLPSVIFRKDKDGGIGCVPYHHGRNNAIATSSGGASSSSSSMPALLVLGGRLRGRTLATCEMLPLSSNYSSSSNNNDDNRQRWISLPNLHEHRGSHAACSPVGSGLAFVMGGGTADGNSDAVEILDFGKFGSSLKRQYQQMQHTTSATGMEEEEEDYDDDCQQQEANDGEWRWNRMQGKLSSPRHAFGAVTCITTKKSEHGTTTATTTKWASLYAVGGWKYGSISCESMERLAFEYPHGEDGGAVDSQRIQKQARWELCAPLLLPRRLHSVAANTAGSSIYVFGGYIDERRTTSSIERYDIDADEWSVVEELPYGKRNCPLVQAVAYQNGFLIFPYSTEQVSSEDKAPLVLRYVPGSDDKPFSPILVPNNSSESQQQQQRQFRLPIANWHSFAATSSPSLNKAYLVGGTICGKWTSRSFELNLDTMEWNELPAMAFARRRLATVVLE